jgi:hypothetical protein
MNYTYQPKHLDAPRLKLILQLRKRSQLCGAHGSEVCGVGEKNGPAVVDELVEVDVAMGGLGVEVGS